MFGRPDWLFMLRKLGPGEPMNCWPCWYPRPLPRPCGWKFGRFILGFMPWLPTSLCMDCEEARRSCIGTFDMAPGGI
jgi:hypothetical protein